MHSVYLTYEEYKNYGGTLPQSAFIPLEFRSRKRVDYLTDSRVQAMQEVPEAVKLCVLSLINLENEVGAEAQSKNTVTSFNTDGYSENYGGKSISTTDEAEKVMNRTVRTYLHGEYDDNGVPLLYRGLDCYAAV